MQRGAKIWCLWSSETVFYCSEAKRALYFQRRRRSGFIPSCVACLHYLNILKNYTTFLDLSFHTPRLKSWPCGSVHVARTIFQTLFVYFIYDRSEPHFLKSSPTVYSSTIALHIIRVDKISACWSLCRELWIYFFKNGFFNPSSCSYLSRLTLSSHLVKRNSLDLSQELCAPS